MRFQTFTASTMAEAMQSVRKTMGDDAVIVSSHKSHDGIIEVTAALETRRTGHIATATSLPEIEDTLERILRARLRSPCASTTSTALPVPSAGETEPSGVAFDVDRLSNALALHSTPQPLTDALIAAARAMDTDDAIQALAGALEVRFGFEPVPLAPPAPIMLVGMPGAGKTVTMMKLAARAVLDGLPADLWSMDTARTGAAAQSDAYAELLEQEMTHIAGINELSFAIDGRTERLKLDPAVKIGPCFIDTTSINPFDGKSLKELRQLIEAARFAGDAEPVLTLSANGDPQTMAEAASMFANLGARRLIITQLDIARRIGGILAAADTSKLALSQVSITPYIVQGLAQLNPVTCARLILGEPEKNRQSRTSATNQA